MGVGNGFSSAPSAMVGNGLMVGSVMYAAPFASARGGRTSMDALAYRAAPSASGYASKGAAVMGVSGGSIRLPSKVERLHGYPREPPPASALRRRMVSTRS